MSESTPQPPSADPDPPAPRPRPAAPGQVLGIDPAVLALLGAGAVLLVALAWLFFTPRPEGEPTLASTARVEALERRVAELDGMRERVVAIEGLRGRIDQVDSAMQQRLAALADLPERVQRLAAQEDRLRALEQRREAPDVAPLQQQDTALAERLAAAERRLGELANRPAVDAGAFAPRQAVEQLTARLDRMTERQEALAARIQATDSEAARRDEALARTTGERIAALERGAGERAAAAERAAAETRQALEQRAAALEQSLGARVAQLDAAQQQRLAALEGRAGRLAALDALRARLDAGQPLGPALRGIGEAPPALARFAETAPPTEAALRLSFEEHARAAREASEPQPAGSGGVLDSAVSRLAGLVTVRRGDDVVWGDAAAAEIERARRALDAGDLEATVARLRRLPPAAQAAMQTWTAQAQALIDARGALRQVAAPAARQG